MREEGMREDSQQQQRLILTGLRKPILLFSSLPSLASLSTKNLVWFRTTFSSFSPYATLLLFSPHHLSLPSLLDPTSLPLNSQLLIFLYKLHVKQISYALSLVYNPTPQTNQRPSFNNFLPLLLLTNQHNGEFELLKPGEHFFLFMNRDIFLQDFFPSKDQTSEKTKNAMCKNDRISNVLLVGWVSM